jgi:hypothetical protein
MRDLEHSSAISDFPYRRLAQNGRPAVRRLKHAFVTDSVISS